VGLFAARAHKVWDGGSHVWRRTDPLLLAVGAVAFFTYWQHGFGGKFSRDPGVYAYGARQVLEGQPPYVGIVNRAGPLAHLLPVPGVVAARVTGKDELLGMRFWYMLLATACVVLAYVVVRGIFASRTVGLAAAATMLSFEGFIHLATTGPREKTPMVLFMLCATWALTRQRWILTGVFIGLATLTLQIAFPPLCAAAIVGVPMLARDRTVRALGLVVAGGGIPVVATVAYFAASGALGDLIDGFLLLNARYTHGRSILSRPEKIWTSMQLGFGDSLWLLLGGLAALVVLAALRLGERTSRREPATAVLVASVAATLVGLAWTLLDFDSWVDAFPFLPFAAIGIGAVIAEVERRLPSGVSLAVAGAVVLPATLLAMHFSAAAAAHTLNKQRATVRAVLQNVPDATIWSIEAPEVLVLARRTNPTRHQLFSEGLQHNLGDTWPGGIKGFVAWNLKRRPDLIVVGRDELRDREWKDRIGPAYVVVARAPGSVWFARRSLGADVIASIRETRHAHRTGR
jgi:hypothetical protein